MFDKDDIQGTIFNIIGFIIAFLSLHWVCKAKEYGAFSFASKFVALSLGFVSVFLVAILIGNFCLFCFRKIFGIDKKLAEQRARETDLIIEFHRNRIKKQKEIGIEVKETK